MGHTLLCVLRFFSLNILLYCAHAQDSVLTIEPNWSTLFTGESVTLICDMKEREDTDWYYTIWKDGHSDVILESPASTLYEGESVTLRCRHRTQRKENAAFYKDRSLIEMDTNHQSLIISNNTIEMTISPVSDGSSYMCKFGEEEESKPIKLKVEPHRPKAQMRKDNRDTPAGGSVTLTCSVSPSSSAWKYFWYRGEKTSEPLTTEEVVFLSHDKIRVSEGGLYWCRGGRGDPVYYTEYSDAIGTGNIVTNRAVVTLQHNWPERYTGETITLTCEIEDGGDTEWVYEWMTPGSYPHKQNEYIIKVVSSSHSGDYRCLGRMKSAQQFSTGWSDAFILTVSDKPQPVLTVSPSWLSPGASVTLSCEVQHPSAGWRFYWYKAVPKLSDNSYRYELLPGSSSNGTEQDSYIVHGQTHTAGYVCTAGRGDPVYYTHKSQLKFVWSGDSAASLTVNPDRVQHFMKDSLSLSCEGNSTEWRVSRFSKAGYLTYCFSWGTMTGSTCNIDHFWQTAAVYWCESETGEFSNAVNITGQYNDMILVSPVHPVAEGDSVTLGCMLRAENVLSTVDFYKNGKLIQNDTRRELTISAVSKSDEGFYKCKGKDSQQGWLRWTSPESWMSVKSLRPESSPFPVLVIVGLVCGVVVIILLLLFVYRYRKTRVSSFIRSQSTNQGSATDHMINQDETQHKEYASLLHGDICLYQSIKDPEEPENDESSDVIYSSIGLKIIVKEGTDNEPEESTVYSDVVIQSAAD